MSTSKIHSNISDLIVSKATLELDGSFPARVGSGMVNIAVLMSWCLLAMASITLLMFDGSFKEAVDSMNFGLVAVIGAVCCSQFLKKLAL